MSDPKLTPEQLQRRYRVGDSIEIAKDVLRAYVERDGNCSARLQRALALSQPDFLGALEELSAYRRELSGHEHATGSSR